MLLLLNLSRLKLSAATSIKIAVFGTSLMTLIGSAGFGYIGVYTFAKCINTKYTCNDSTERRNLASNGLDKDFSSPVGSPMQDDDVVKTPKSQQAEPPSTNDHIQPNEVPGRPSPKTTVPNAVNRGYYQQAYDWAIVNKDCSYKTCQNITHWIWPNWGVESFYHRPPEVGAGAIASHDGANVLRIGNANRMHGGSNECYESKGGLILRLSGEDNIDILGDGTPNKVMNQLNEKTPKHIVWKKLDGFYFMYAYPPSGLCPAEYADEQKAFIKLVQDMVRNLVPYEPKKDKCKCSNYTELIKYIDTEYPST